jgi:hypothetical protein
MIDIELFTVLGHKFELSGAGLMGAVLVISAGRWLARHKGPETPSARA